MSNIESKNQILLEIAPEYSNEVIHFLIENKIAFSMDYKAILPEPQKINTQLENVSPKYKIEERNALQAVSSLVASPIEKIYNRYIVRGFDKALPKIIDLANEFNISVVKLKKDFQNRYGKTIYQVYLDKKMEHATELLKEGLTATVISNRMGYSHPIKFNKMFQKHYGITPKKYQLQHR